MGTKQIGKAVLPIIMVLAVFVFGVVVVTMMSGNDQTKDSGELTDQVSSENQEQRQFEPKVVPQPASQSQASPQPELVTKPELVAQPKPVPVIPVSIPVFASKDDEKPFTSFSGWGDLIVTEPGSDWSKVASAKGFPVWISAPLVDKLGSSHVRVKGNNVNLRSLPQVQGSRVLARAQRGDIMKINRKQGEWLRVWSQVRVEAWAKSEKLVPKNVPSSLVETAM